VGGGATGYAVTTTGLDATPARSLANLSSSAAATGSPNAPIKITGPSDGSAVRECITVSGTGAVPAGEALVIADQQQGDDQRYFEEDVSVNPGDNTWSAGVTIGQDSDAKASYTIYAILMGKSLAEYLSTMQSFNDASNTWWASPQWPAGSTIAAQINVHRFAIDHC
jgi:hypothetical protein